MSAINDEIITAIRQMVIKHYEPSDARPLLLADLGLALRKQNLWLANEQGGKSLRQVIEDAADPDIVIVRDQYAPARIAVTTGAAKPKVEAAIESRRATTSEIPDLDLLPHSFVLAFCKRSNDGSSVFLRNAPPFKFEVTKPTEETADQFIEVEERYRTLAKVTSVSDLTAMERLDVQKRIASWCRDKGISIRRFYRATEKHHTNALTRLIAAQPSGLAGRILIPGDIALILSQHE
jgi:hypothetical protein